MRKTEFRNYLKAFSYERSDVLCYCQVFSEKVCWMSFLTIRTREPITNPMCPR